MQRSKADGAQKNPFASKCERVKAESADEPSLPIGLGAWQGAGSVQIQSSIQNLERMLGDPPPFPVALDSLRRAAAALVQLSQSSVKWVYRAQGTLSVRYRTYGF